MKLYVFTAYYNTIIIYMLYHFYPTVNVFRFRNDIRSLVVGLSNGIESALLQQYCWQFSDIFRHFVPSTESNASTNLSIISEKRLYKLSLSKYSSSSFCISCSTIIRSNHANYSMWFFSRWRCWRISIVSSWKSSGFIRNI